MKKASMEVQSRVSESEKLIDIMKNYRENWTTAEKEKGTSKALESVRYNGNDCDVSRPVSSLQKRGG